MNDVQKTYSTQWNDSASYFYNEGSYCWMCDQIKQYKTILEIGCGTGQSTLSLLESGHKVISIEKNNFCIEKAMILLKEKGYKLGSINSDLHECDSIIFKNELFDNNLMNYLSKFQFDAVICWNVGSYWNEEMINYYIPYMLEYGLTIDQISSNMESSYSELIIWKSCNIANNKKVPVHIIDRAMETLTKINDNYYITLKNEFKFSEIVYENKKVTTLSNSGRNLVCNGEIHTNDIIAIYLNSIIMK